jgi:hypothetical protein
MIDNKIKNEMVRQRFFKFYEDNYNPNCKAICQELGINHPDFYRWKADKLDYGVKSLTKISRFLESKNF